MNVDKIIQRRFKIYDTTIPLIGKGKYTRNDLLTLFNDLGFKIGAEVGVLEGSFSLEMVKRIPGLELTCVDPWSNDIKVHSEESYKKAVDALSGYNINFKKMISMDAIKEMEDESLDFVYIDAHHGFDYAITDIIEWSKKVRAGGVVSGHDYHVNVNYGVIHAVEAYTRAHNISSYYITRERKPSWFWVKPKGN